MSVLLVLDPNWRLCYETVEIDEFARAGLLPWVSELRDALTLHTENPEGDFLEVSKDLYILMCIILSVLRECDSTCGQSCFQGR